MNETKASLLIRIAIAWLNIARRHPGDVEAIDSALNAATMAQAELDAVPASA